MSNNISGYVKKQQITSCRLVSDINLDGIYYNGILGNGVQSTFTIDSSSLTIDSVVCENDDRILLSNQNNKYENGVYRISGIGDENIVLTRSNDFQNSEQIKPGYFIPISDGSTRSGSIYNIISPQVQNIGIDSILFEEVSSSPTALYLSSDGLRILDPDSSNTLTVSFESNLTSNRNLSLKTGDSDRELDISAADVTITVFGSTVLNDDDFSVGLNTLGIEQTLSDIWAGGSTNFTFTALNITDNAYVIASIISSTNNVSITKTESMTSHVNVTFSGDPGANTRVSFIAINNIT